MTTMLVYSYLLCFLTASGDMQNDQSVHNDRAESLGQTLRCPVCQGMPISESPSTMAQDMMKRVHVMVDEGHSDFEIQQYFVARYGEWVLLEPSHEGPNWILWSLPPAAISVGVLWTFWYVRRRTRARARSEERNS